MAPCSFNHFVQREIGKFPHVLIYAALEWALIIILFLDGFIAFVANEFAKFFELPIPCLLCSRIDYLVVCRNPKFSFNDSICESHRKDASFIALCHTHKRLSDNIRMCENCIISKKNCDCDTYKSLVEDDSNYHLNPNSQVQLKNEGCSCCGEALMATSSYARFGGGANGAICVHSQTPMSTPQALPLKQVQNHTFQMSYDTYENDFVVPDDEDCLNASSMAAIDTEYAKAVASESEYPNEESIKTAIFMSDEACRTPNFLNGSRFFGAPLTDSAKSSPRWTSHLQRNFPLEKSALAAFSKEKYPDSILHRLKMQIHMDRKSLIALYMELDEERSASAIAAKNAMAMITRLQAEKAAVQMEALQYRRMKEEEEEYEQEVLMGCRDFVFEGDEEMKDLQGETVNCSKGYRLEGMKRDREGSYAFRFNNAGDEDS